uniref:Ethanolaminephosphotransferase n=1 Tax=Alexandrium monilatum TaxID=311494 RepID=A0A7S4RAT4_9DINO
MRRTRTLRERRGRPGRISDAGLEALAAHKYKAGLITPIDRVLYAIWWGPLAKQLPLWLAPNALTMAACVAAISSGLLLWACAPSLEEELPFWAEMTAFLLTMFYQTCDALDGMQARRTGAASPLGGLLDHGSDCLCLTSFTLGYCASQRLGFGPSTFFSLCVSWLPWWLAQWEAYHTGVVRTGGEFFGITEIELVVASIHLISALGGPDVWKTFIPVPGLPGGGSELRHICTCIQITVATVLSILNLSNGLAWARAHGVTTAAVRRLRPMAVLVAVTLLWPVTLPGLHPRLLCACVSALYSRLAAELVLCHMTHEEYPSPQPALAVLPALYIAGVLGLLSGTAGTVAMAVFTAWCVAGSCRYLFDVVDEVSTHLGVLLLRIGKRED